MRKICQLLMLLPLFSFCGKDFLNVPSKGVLIKEEYVKNLQTTKEYLNGVYSKLPDVLASYYLLYADVVADNIKPLVGKNTFSSHYNWAQKEDNSNNSNLNMNAISMSSYNLILSCNFVIEKADEFKSEDEQISRSLKGQALALRAILHFNLVNVFAQPYGYSANADHPGITIVKTSDWTAAVSHRNTVAEVYAGVTEDLRTAINLLPPGERNTIFLQQNAAKAFLSRVYLYQKKHREACNLAREVLAAVPLMTANYPQKLFTLQETEAIFQLPQHDQGLYLFASYYFRGSVDLVASNDMAVILNEQPTDLRKGWITSTTNGWQVVKYPQGIIPGISTPSVAYYHTLLRSSEMCLAASECYAKLGASYEDSARFFLDAIRKRANSQAIVTSATGNALLDSIYKERRKELAFEGFRMYDLLRCGKGVLRNDVSSGQAKELPYPSNYAIAPIPENDVLLANIPQNPGY